MQYIRQLREDTHAPITWCKEALDVTGFNLDRARELIVTRQINELEERTGAESGMCRLVLASSSGDIEAATKQIRHQQQEVSMDMQQERDRMRDGGLEYGLCEDPETGFVSVWVGTISSKDAFDQLIKESYETDDEPISEFARQIGVDYYDHDFTEFVYLQQNESLLSVLEKCSYAESFITQVAAQLADLNVNSGNALFVIYDHRADERFIPGHQTDGLRFIGTFRYTK